jgi:cobalt/nickel transport system permease protein
VSGAAHGAEAVGPVETAVHRLAPQCKVAALLAFVVAVALVPYRHAWPYAIDAGLLAAVVVASRTPPSLLARRLVVEIPFVAFVLVLPFIAQGPQVDVLGVGVARDGLWAAGGIAAKATLAVLATGVLAATTPVPEIVAGLERMRAPRQLTAIGGFALRYLQLVLDELGRLRNARIARGDDPRWLWQARTAARCAGALAVRCLQRGERVHAAMLARGYEGRMPATGLEAPARPLAWAAALALPAIAVAATIAVRGLA